MEGKRIAFIGAGSITEAILAGLLQNGITTPDQVTLVNKTNKERLQYLKNRFKLLDRDNLHECVIQSEIVILAVKPKSTNEMLEKWGKLFHRNQIILSVIAGVTTQHIEGYLNEPIPVIRAMPNTSCAVGMSATALCKGRWATNADFELAKRIFRAIGTVVIVEEDLMDAVTGLSGSGPAYFYYMMEALEEAGVRLGLQREVARALLVQTILGAAHMLQKTGKDPAILRKEVTSEGGTTMAGLTVLEQYSFREGVVRAAERATMRSKELGRMFQ
jgi:pyrroline-5-carboxylate reductase